MADEALQELQIKLSSLCVLLNRPQIINGWCRDILAHHFQEGQHEHPELARLIWRNTERTSILIETHTKWAPLTTGKRPAIIFKRNACENVRLGIADRHQGLSTDGFEHFTTFWAGSTTFFCIGETGAQAEVLATEVQRELTQFGPAIRECLQLMRLRVLSIGEVSILEESTQNFVVPVTIGYTYDEGWSMGPEAPRLSKISLSLSNLIDV